MHKTALIILPFVLAVFYACAPQPNSTNNVENKKVNSPDEITLKDRMSVDIMVETLNKKYREINNHLDDSISIKTSYLREKIKQKWLKIEYYTNEKEVVKIKTHPYPEITKRTEEFYLEDGNLLIASVNDGNSTNAQNLSVKFDKIYYFSEGDLIYEKNETNEGEYSIKDSDGEELLQEVTEYLEVYHKNRTQ